MSNSLNLHIVENLWAISLSNYCIYLCIINVYLKMLAEATKAVFTITLCNK